MAVVTTHLGRLKDFAYRHTGAENGSMAFDGASLRPLYRLDVGIPGASHALDIAERVGMPKAAVVRARKVEEEGPPGSSGGDEAASASSSAVSA